MAPDPYLGSSHETWISAASRLLALDFDGGKPLMLADKDWALTELEATQNRLVSLTPADDDGVLVQLRTYPRAIRRPDGSHQPAAAPSSVVYRVDVYTGELKEQTRMNAAADFYADSEGEVRLAHVPENNATVTYHYRLPGDPKWHRWREFADEKFGSRFRPLHPLAGTSRFLSVREHQGRLALFDLDVKAAKAQLVSTASDFDVDHSVVTPRGRFLGVEYGGDRIHPADYLDARARSVIEAARYFHPDVSHAIVDSAVNENVFLLRSSSDVDGGTFRVLDLSNGPAPIEQIGAAYPELARESLPRMTWIKYRARDGEMVPAFLTSPSTPLAGLVVLPHDGPADRTRWQFDYLRAFLVSRGYAVLQMDYRGSTGYGRSWEKAGFREWDARIHTDIADGARWAIEQRLTDPKRICIAGFGFGGYQALLAAARAPDVYRCAISIGAWTDLSRARLYAGPLTRKEMPSSNAARLRARSPLWHAEDIRIPILLVHAELDQEVPVEESIRMAAELDGACRDHELVVIPRAERGLRWQSDRVTLLSSIERFLASRLATASSPKGCEAG